MRLLSSAEACRRLGVKKPTLYAYVSRGLIRRVERGGRSRLYVADDVDRVAARSAARRGHGPVAAGALRWGEPVLDSAITSVEHGVLRYRGRDVLELVAAEATFEEVAELLWQTEAPGAVAAWPVPRALPRQRSAAAPLWRLVAALPLLALSDAARFGGQGEVELDRGRALIMGLARILAGPGSLRGARIAQLLCARAGAGRLIDALLVLCADHELNVSTFAARVAASAGADLYACVGAGLYAFSGPGHGASCDRVEALLQELGARSPAQLVRERLSRGESLPGFGHRLYPAGDPRTPPLLALVSRFSGKARDVRSLLRLVEIVERDAGLRPTVDLGAVAVARALGMPAGSATAMFALARTAGWIAHTLEQRQSGVVLRPRARYVGA